MPENLDLSILENLSLNELVELPTGVFLDLQTKIAELKAKAAQYQARFEEALNGKFGREEQLARNSQRKEFGVIHIMSGEYDVTIDNRKDVTWDQEKISEIRGRIIAHGDNPDLFIKSRYSVSETVFENWPAEIKQTFEVARSVKPRKHFAIKEKAKS